MHKPEFILENQTHKIIWYREKKDKNLKLARELRKLWNIKVTVIPIVIGMFGIVPKVLERGLEELKIKEQIEIIQTTALLW